LRQKIYFLLTAEDILTSEKRQSYHHVMETVSLLHTDRYDAALRQKLSTLLAPLGGMSRFVKPGERVLIKPNMLAAKPPDAAVTTHPVLVQAVIEMVKACGGIPLVGDSPGIGSARKVAARAGILTVIEETGAELVEFSESVERQGGGTFKRIGLARPYVEADRVINLPKLKTHEMMTMTCAVKNLFGAVVGTAKAAWHLKAGADRALFARMLVEIYLLREPDLTIVDAVVGMEGKGPGSGDPRPIGALIAGTNALAVDVIAAELVGIPKKLLYIERAAEAMGLPGTDRREITVIGDKLDRLRLRDFRLAPINDVQFGLPGFLKKLLRNHLTSRPVQNPAKCVLCGVCAEACPPRVITITGTRFTIDYQRCIRCFCCRELCPHDALDVYEGPLLKLLRHLMYAK
jgi:uncharacterized protein (DUF362 family)/Pyruvate/2-oxoacid:ferredoxin oxidoreductase delta subunit